MVAAQLLAALRGLKMQASMWIRLIQRLPEEVHGNIVLMTNSGIEIKVLKIFRLEEDFVVLRARLTGANDDGRVMVIPYQCLNGIAVDRKLNDRQVGALFGDESATQEFSKQSLNDEIGDDSSMLQVELESANLPSSDGEQAKPPSKSILLARLRERLSKHSNSD